MAKSDESALSEMMKQTQTAVTLNPMLSPQIEHYWQAQEKMLQEVEAFTKNWFERRHTATKTALTAVGNVANGGSVSPDALTSLSDWQKHSMERVVEDFRGWVELCTRCAGHVAAAEVDAEKEGLEKVAKQVGSGSSTKHAMPV